MTLKYKTIGFVFKKSEGAESDQVFSIFTKDFGKLELKAKAIRKITSKLRADIDIFYLSEVEFIQGKNNKTLTDAVKIKKLGIFEKDLENFLIAGKIANVLDIFIRGEEKDEDIFNLLNDILFKLEDDRLKIKNRQLIFQYFFWNFLSLQGYGLEVDNCAACHSKLDPHSVYFSEKEGGIICEKCYAADKKAKKINSDIVKVLRIILKKDWDTLSKLKMESFSRQLLSKVSESAMSAFCPS